MILLNILNAFDMFKKKKEKKNTKENLMVKVLDKSTIKND